MSFMKKFFTFAVFLSLFFFRFQGTHAHLLGQPPYFKVDGVYSVFYSVQSYSTSNIIPPQDFATGPYIVNTPIVFELDKSQLASIIPLEIVEKTTFVWDFGDGSKGRGFVNNHIYKKTGPYIVTIYADTSSFERGVEPQLLQSTFLNILPQKNYQVPVAIIKINGKEVIQDVNTDTTQNVFPVTSNTIVRFDASSSKLGSSKIDSYEWDFGDGTTGSGSLVEHTYKSGFAFLAPVLKITDANGFYSEVSVGIKESNNVSAVPMTGMLEGEMSLQQPTFWIICLIAIFVIAVFFVVLKIKKR